MHSCSLQLIWNVVYCLRFNCDMEIIVDRFTCVLCEAQLNRPSSSLNLCGLIFPQNVDIPPWGNSSYMVKNACAGFCWEILHEKLLTGAVCSDKFVVGSHVQWRCDGWILEGFGYVAVQLSWLFYCLFVCWRTERRKKSLKRRIWAQAGLEMPDQAL